jgi:hypothetical protein
VPQRTPQARRVLRNAQDFGFGCASSEAQREVRVIAVPDVGLAAPSAQSSGCRWACRREDLCFERLCLGAGGVIDFWNGTTWAVQQCGKAYDLLDINGSVTGTGWAVGTGGTILESTSGTTWSGGRSPARHSPCPDR